MTVGVEGPERSVLRLEGEVRAIDDLARGREAIHRGHAGIDERDIDAGARVPGVPIRSRTDVLRRVVHGVHVGRRVIAGRRGRRRHQGGKEQRGGHDGTEATMSVEGQTPAALALRRLLRPGAALRATHLHHPYRLLRDAMCGAWQPGGLRKLRATGRSLALRPRLSTGLPCLQTSPLAALTACRGRTVRGPPASTHRTKVLFGAPGNHVPDGCDRRRCEREGAVAFSAAGRRPHGGALLLARHPPPHGGRSSRRSGRQRELLE